MPRRAFTATENATGKNVVALTRARDARILSRSVLSEDLCCIGNIARASVFTDIFLVFSFASEAGYDVRERRESN